MQSIKKIFILFLLGWNMQMFSFQTYEFSKNSTLTISDFYDIVFLGRKAAISEESKVRLIETREFVDYLLQNNVCVYGLTTGFGDLRNCPVSPEEAGNLSKNIIQSHDAGIGKPLPDEVVLGAMVVRANSLAQGNSAFKVESLQTLIDMINAKIIPLIPSSGSLGASGDLAFLARLGRAMEGDCVPVFYNGEITTADEALKEAGIQPFVPDSKEGLALTNGTAFMASMIAIAYLRELHELENILAMEGVFLNAVHAIDAAFLASIHDVRRQDGQSKIAGILRQFFVDSPFIDHTGIQNDYSIRCLPQIFGPKIELFLSYHPIIERELNAATDNPLLFKDEEISKETPAERIIHFNQSKWSVLSGGNFHGEYIASLADAMAVANVKIALTMERQITFVMNPARNGEVFPIYLIKNEEDKGLLSGFMMPQYTANALTHKISLLGNPASIYNLTSSNEAEDIVSYGATAAEKLIEQLDLMHQLNTIYLTVVMQAYSLARENFDYLNPFLPSERIYNSMRIYSNYSFPITDDIPFDIVYQHMSDFSNELFMRRAIGFPLLDELGIKAAFSNKSYPKNPFMIAKIF